LLGNAALLLISGAGGASASAIDPRQVEQARARAAMAAGR